MYHRTICCHVLKDMLYCPHETGRFFYSSGGSGFLSIQFRRKPSNLAKNYLPVSKNTCTIVHLSTCTNGTSPSDRMHEKKVGEFDFWRREIALFIKPQGQR